MRKILLSLPLLSIAAFAADKDIPEDTNFMRSITSPVKDNVSNQAA